MFVDVQIPDVSIECLLVANDEDGRIEEFSLFIQHLGDGVLKSVMVEQTPAHDQEKSHAYGQNDQFETTHGQDPHFDVTDCDGL